MYNSTANMLVTCFILFCNQGRGMQGPVMRMGMQGMGMGYGMPQMAANPYAAMGAAAPNFNAGMGAPAMQLQRGLRGLDPGMSYNPFSVSTNFAVSRKMFIHRSVSVVKYGNLYIHRIPMMSFRKKEH